MKILSFLTLLSGLLIPFQLSSQDQAITGLETRIYQVAPGLTGSLARSLEPSKNSSPSDYDPFRDPAPSEEGESKELKPIQFYLKESGVEFPQGATATLDTATNHFTFTNKPSEITKVEKLLHRHSNASEKQFFIYLEMIEVDHADFSDWIFENVMTSDATELRNEVQNWIREGDAEIIESATVAARSGQRAKVESIDEYIYPTEYNPPSIPNKVTLQDGAEAPVAAASPTAYETRHLGTTLEVDPVLAADGETFNLNLAPENIVLDRIEQWHHRAEDPRFKVHFPVFYTMKITTQAVGTSGRYVFLGTTRPLKPADPDRENPLVLQFVRADVGSTGDWQDITDVE